MLVKYFIRFRTDPILFFCSFCFNKPFYHRLYNNMNIVGSIYFIVEWDRHHYTLHFFLLCFESFTCVFTIPVGHIWAVDFRCKWLLPLLRMKKFIYFPWNSSVTWIIFVFHYQRCYYFGLVLDFTSLPYFDCSIYYPI